MKQLGTTITFAFVTSLVGNGVALAKTAKDEPAAKQVKHTAKQAKVAVQSPASSGPLAVVASPGQSDELLPLVGKKSPFGDLAPAPTRTATTTRSKRVGLHQLHSRATRAPVELGRRSMDAALPSNEVMLRMELQRLDSRQINEVIRANVSRIQVCYERAVAIGRAPTGAVSVRFVVEPTGVVSSADVACGKHNHVLKRCLEHRVRSWKFPRADAPTTVDYPFVFDVAESKPTSPKRR